jgi:hypothetical protein
MSYAAQKPDIEIRREIGPGHYRSYANIYWHPLRVWVLGRWLIGGKQVRAAWAKVEAEEGSGGSTSFGS